MKILLPFLVLALLCGVSLFVGVSELTLGTLFQDDPGHAWLVLLDSRLPRTAALVIAGASMAIAGSLMQMIARNHFVEPSNVGTVEWAALGILVVLFIAPGADVFIKMGVAAGFAVGGTAIFLVILSRIPLRSPLIVPLVGIIYAGIVNAVTTFVAYRFNMLQALGIWMSGDFSTVLRGRYELLLIAGGLAGLTYWFADRFTIISMGKDVATNLGIGHARTVALGVCMVATVTTSVVVTVGIVPFLGLIVPNILRLVLGDRLRQSLPWIALGGATMVLVCDMAGRLVIAPFEVPVGTVLGVIGSASFLYLLAGRRSRAA